MRHSLGPFGFRRAGAGLWERSGALPSCAGRAPP